MNKRSLFVYWRDLTILPIFLPALLISLALIGQIVELHRTSVKSQVKDLVNIQASEFKSEILNIVVEWQAALAKIKSLSPPSQRLASIYTNNLMTRFDSIEQIQIYSEQSELIDSIPGDNPSLTNKPVLSSFVEKLILLPDGRSLNIAVVNNPIGSQIEEQQLWVASPIQWQNQTNIIVIVITLKKLQSWPQVNRNLFIEISDIEPKTEIPKHLQDWQLNIQPFMLFNQPLWLNYATKNNNIAMPIIRAIISVLLLGVAVIVPSILITNYFARKLFSPLMSVNQLVQQYAKGNFEADMDDTPFIELNNLRDFLKDMAVKVSRSKAELEEKVAERAFELEQANSELLKVLESVEEMQEHAIASEKMSSLGRLVAGIAHEINTPVGVALTASTTLQGLTQNLKQKTETSSLTKTELKRNIAATLESCQILITNLHRAADLVHNFKEVAVDQSTEGLRQFNLQQYISDVLSTIRPRYKHYQIEFIEEIDPLLSLNNYPGAIAQIVTNLCENSALHGFQQYQSHMIKITASKVDEEYIEIVYQDDGSGLSDNEASHIFDPFFTTSRQTGASGLGMHIVFNLITQKLKGTIAIERPTIGVSFRIRIAVDAS